MLSLCVHLTIAQFYVQLHSFFYYPSLNSVIKVCYWYNDRGLKTMQDQKKTRQSWVWFLVGTNRHEFPEKQPDMDFVISDDMCVAVNSNAV